MHTDEGLRLNTSNFTPRGLQPRHFPLSANSMTRERPGLRPSYASRIPFHARRGINREIREPCEKGLPHHRDHGGTEKNAAEKNQKRRKNVGCPGSRPGQAPPAKAGVPRTVPPIGETTKSTKPTKEFSASGRRTLHASRFTTDELSTTETPRARSRRDAENRGRQ